MHDLLPNLLFQAAEQRPDGLAISHRDEARSWAELLRDAEGVAGWLRATGLREGDRVGLLTSDPHVHVAAYFGAILAGGLAVPLNAQNSPRGLRTLLADAEPSHLVADVKVLPAIEEAVRTCVSIRAVAVTQAPSERGALDVVPFDEVRRSPPAPRSVGRRDTDPAVVLYTSGTTAEPKGVVLSHRNLLANTRSIVKYLRLVPDDRVMHVLPLFYSYGNSVLLTHIAAAGSIVVSPFTFPSVVLEQMERREVTGFSGVPSTYAVLLEHGAFAEPRFPRLRYLTQSGAPMSVALVHRILDAFPRVELFLMYGQTEASTRLTWLPPAEARRRPGSVGKAIDGVEIDLLDAQGRPVAPGEIGEVVARGDNVMLGYWRRDDLTAEVLRGGRLFTHDLARRDDDGYLHLAGRKSDFMKSAGHRIAPGEIEEVLREHPAVREAGVVGVPDEIAGDAIEACVVLVALGAATEKQLVNHCRSLLPAFKVPRRIHMRSALPTTATGKLRRAVLRAELEALSTGPSDGASAGPKRNPGAIA